VSVLADLDDDELGDLSSITGNYINGNLATAKQQVARGDFTRPQVREYFQEVAGYSFKKSTYTVDWLFGDVQSRQPALDCD